MQLQNLGWRGPYRDGELAGTVGESRRLEAIKITISDDDEDEDDVEESNEKESRDTEETEEMDM